MTTAEFLKSRWIKPAPTQPPFPWDAGMNSPPVSLPSLPPAQAGRDVEAAQREFKEDFCFYSLARRTQCVQSHSHGLKGSALGENIEQLIKKSLKSPGVMYSLSASIHNTVTYCKKVAFGVVPLRNNLRSGGAGASSRPSVRALGAGGSVPLAGVQAGRVGRAVLSLQATRQPLGARAALEELQAVSAFPPVPGAHLPLPQHRLADLGPEVAGAAQPGRAVRRAQAEVALLSCVGTARGMLRRAGTRWGHWSRVGIPD